MGISNFTQEDFLTFFAVLVRISVLIAVFPVFGDRLVPPPIKVLLSLAITTAIYPVLVGMGQVSPSNAAVWGLTSSGIAGVIGIEVVFALALAFSARVVFDAIQIGGDITGSLMGFSTASMYDPHQESQSQVIAQLQMTFAMLIFLGIDGHHLFLSATVKSFEIVGLGGAKIGAQFSEMILKLSGETLRLGLQLAAPTALTFFGVNIVYGIFAKAMPQINILILSFSISALVGMFVLLISYTEFHETILVLFERLGWRLQGIVSVLSGR